MVETGCDPTCNPSALMCCSPECETRELARRARLRAGWLSNEEIARHALDEHLISTGSYYRPGGVQCGCGEHRAVTPADRSDHKADSIVTALRRAGRLLE